MVLKLFSRVISSESFVLYCVMYLLTIDIYQSIFVLRQKKKKSPKSLTKINVVGRWAMLITSNPVK